MISSVYLKCSLRLLLVHFLLGRFLIKLLPNNEHAVCSLKRHRCESAGRPRTRFYLSAFVSHSAFCLCVHVQGECRYEQELLPYLDKVDAASGRRRKQKGTKTGTKTTNSKAKASRPSWSELQYIDEEFEEEEARTAGLLTTLATRKQRPPAEHSNEPPYDDSRDHFKPEAVCLLPSNGQTAADGCAAAEDLIEADREPVSVDNISQRPAKSDDDEDVELQAMFYLRKWDAAPLPCSNKLLPRSHESLKVILANVDELLSRSPPSLVDDLEAPPSLPPSPQHPPQPFVVSFSLDVDEDEDDSDEVITKAAEKPSDELPEGQEGSKVSRDRPDQKKQPVRATANSPTWDEVFGEEVNDVCDVWDDDKETDDVVKDDQVHVEADGASEEKQSRDDVRDEEMPDVTDGDSKADKASDRSSEMDESIDLFEDDEAFLQMTIPDIPTPEDGVTPTTPSAEKKTEPVRTHTPTNPSSTVPPADGAHTSKTVQSDGEDFTYSSNDKKIIEETNTHNTTETKCNMHTPAQAKTAAVTLHFKSPESFDSSRDLFPVNFDLGYSLEESEDEDEPEAITAPCMPASSPPNKQPDSTTLPAVSHSFTPCSSFAEQRIPALCSEPKLSTPQILSRCTTYKSPALPSPIASPGARRTLQHGPPSGLKRRRAQGGSTEAERESTEVSDSLHRPGLFNLLKTTVLFVSAVKLPPCKCRLLPQGGAAVTARTRLCFIKEDIHTKPTPYHPQKW